MPVYLGDVILATLLLVTLAMLLLQGYRIRPGEEVEGEGWTVQSGL